MRKIICIILLLLPTTIIADELLLILASHHINSALELNEDNYGLGYRDNSRNIEYGFFRNSFHKTTNAYAKGIGYSIYIKKRVYSKQINNYVSLNIDAGVSLYGKDGVMPILPLVQPVIVLKVLKDININIGYIPRIKKEKNMYYENDVLVKDERIMYGILSLTVGYSF